MLAVTIGGTAHKHGADYERTDGTDDSYHLLQDAIVSPLTESLFKRFREAIICHCGEVLRVKAVVAPCLKQFFAPHQTERIPVVRAHHVGAAFAPIKRQQVDTSTETPTLIGKSAAIFVIGMGDDHQHTRTCMKFEECLPSGSCPPVRRDRKRIYLDGAFLRERSDRRKAGCHSN